MTAETPGRESSGGVAPGLTMADERSPQ
ncbi:hypothetical protein D854_gp28 [Streptomyces phage R4]|uniref:Uncharacterized protein n=1 Tax=Streptomyces phage R4 TaxID=10732 RepID=K4IBC6_9CAUD|nr:hypothetical protein D854_gp28 [Streptomyces phage R4]AFU62114.1 hypothetical protein R4_60.1 [Streptomyces phage R4]